MTSTDRQLDAFISHGYVPPAITWAEQVHRNARARHWERYPVGLAWLEGERRGGR